MVLAHYFREDGREEARAEANAAIEKARAEAQAEIKKAEAEARAENENIKDEKAELRWRIYELEREKMQAELDDLRKRVEALEAAQAKQADE